MNWADFYIGVLAGWSIVLVGCITLLFVAMKNQQKIATVVMKRMMSSGMKAMKQRAGSANG